MQDDKILIPQLKALYEGVYSAAFSSVLLSVISYYMFAKHSSNLQYTSLSLGFVIISYALRSYDAWLYFRTENKKRKTKIHFKQYGFLTYLSALSWSVFFLALFPKESAQQVYIVLIAVGVSSAALSSLSYSRVVIHGYLGIIFIPLMMRLTYEGTPSSITLLMLVSLFLIFLFISAKRFHSNFIQNIELVLTTQEQDKSLRDYHQKLEQIVEDRTQKLNDNLKRMDLAFASAKQGWFDLNIQTGELEVSDEYSRMLGINPSDNVHHTADSWGGLIHPNDREKTIQMLQEALDSGQTDGFEYRRKTANGEWLWLHSTGEVIERNSANEPTRLIGIHTDISQRKLVEQQNDARSLVLEQVINGIPLKNTLLAIVNTVEQENSSILCSILLVDSDGDKLITGAAPSLPDFFNEAVNGSEISSDIGSFGLAAVMKKRVIIEDIQSDMQCPTFKSIATQAKLGSCWSEPIMGLNNKLLGILTVYHREQKIPEENDFKLMEFAAKLSAVAIERNQSDEDLKLFSRVVKEAREGIMVTDTNGLIIDVNPAFHRITGYRRDEVIGKNPNLLRSGKHSPEFYKDIWRSLKEQGHWQGELWNRTKAGELYVQSQTISSILDDDGNTLNYVGIFSDVTQTKKHQQALEMMAHYDVLTQLPNRTLFADRFVQAAAHSNRNDTMLAVCYLDLDGFKPVNDTYGHDVGDQLLIEVAERIKSCIRDGDTISRQGGDEFTLLLGDIESFQQCEQIMGRIHQSLAETYVLGKKSINISASSGMTIYPLDDADLDTLLRHADQAMYKAKLDGRNRYHLFNAEEDQQAAKTNKKLQEIEHALATDEFTLYFQPKVNMRTGDVFGVEALIRWQHPELGLQLPFAFLPLIEGTELEIKLGDWVINNVMSQMDLWRENGVEIEVSVNVSSNYLQSPLFVSELEQALNKYPQVPTKFVQLEILESSALGDLRAISNIVRNCRELLGVSIALDDFGTGYSSLTHLRNLSADTIKIDQTFVRDMLEDPSDYAIIDGVIGLATAFNRNVVAEGVETISHGLMLLSMGCEQVQGYIIAKPMPADSFLSWLDTYIPIQEWIDSADEEPTQQENKLRIVKITTDHWFNNFEEKLLSKQEANANWPITDHTKCHHGVWIQRSRLERQFSKKWLDKLDDSHFTMHQLANTLINHYQQGDVDVAREGLDKLKQLFNEMMEMLELSE